MTIEAVIFDWGGTLTPWKTIDAARRRGAPTPRPPTPDDAERAREAAGALLAADAARWAHRARRAPARSRWPTSLQDAAAEHDERALDAYREFWVQATHTDPEAAPMLRRLRERGLRLGVLSSTPWPGGLARGVAAPRRRARPVRRDRLEQRPALHQAAPVGVPGRARRASASPTRPAPSTWATAPTTTSAGPRASACGRCWCRTRDIPAVQQVPGRRPPRRRAGAAGRSAGADRGLVTVITKLEVVLVLAVDTATPAVTAGVVELTADAVRPPRPGSPTTAASTPSCSCPPCSACADGGRAARGGRGGHGTGPGPFTGLRVGMVTAAALGDALGVPVHGVCSLDAIAPTRATGAAAGRHRRPPPRGLLGRLRRPDGPTARRPGRTWTPRRAGRPAPSRRRGGGRDAGRRDLGSAGPAAPAPAGLVAVAAAALRGGVEPGPLEPLYLRRPDAVEPAGRKRVTA